MDNLIMIREYKSIDKNAVLELIRLNIPKYFASSEEDDFSRYLDSEIELYYVLLFDKKTCRLWRNKFFR